MLISGIFRNYAFKSLTLGSVLNCHPFDVNSKTQKITPTTSKLRFYGWIFNILACIFALLVSTYRLLTNKSFTVKKLSNLSKTASRQEIKEVLEASGAVFTVAICLYVQIAMIVVYKQVPGVFRQILGYEMYFREKYSSRESLRKRRGRTDVIGILFAVLYYLPFTMCAYVTFFLVTNPASGLQMFKLFQEHGYFYADGAKCLINCVVVLYYFFTLITHTQLWVILHGLIVIFVIEIVGEISDIPRETKGKNQMEKDRFYWTRDLLRYPHATAKTYRELQILLKIGYDVGYASLHISQFTVYTCIVGWLYILIRTDNVELKLFALNAVLNNLLLFFLESVLFDKVYKNSCKFLSGWLPRSCARLEVKAKVKFGIRRGRTGNIVGPMATGTETSMDQAINNEAPAPEGDIQISKQAREWMEKSHKSFKPMKINLGLFFADDTNHTFSGLLCIVGNLIDILVAF